MSIGNAIYKVIIGPLELFFEVVFSISNRYLENPGLAIIFLSLAMNLLVLPLYRRADIMQAEQRDREAKLEKWTAHIKKTFKGDERFMMLQTYYRQNNYKPTDALKGSVSLALEIPFFISAYQFLASLPALQGVSFGPIADLGQPDALIKIGAVSVNVLPVLMTAINFISAAIYLKGFPRKSKIQMYAVALVFLVFLYKSPAGLVFYWTLNNVFSLAKNIFYKLKNPGKVLAILSSVLGAVLCCLLFARGGDLSTKKKLAVIIASAALQLPLLIPFLKGKRKLKGHINEPKSNTGLYTCCCGFLAVLTGVLIPSAVIKASPTEFVNYLAFKSQLWFVLDSGLLAFGTFVLWFGIFYRLADNRGRSILDCVLLIGSAVAAVDYGFFGTKYGTISYTLKYEIYPEISETQMLFNLGVILLVATIIFIIWKKKKAIASTLCITLLFASAVTSIVNLVIVYSDTKETMDRIYSTNSAVFDQPEINLSKDGRNVVVIVLDRAMGAFTPYIFEERPELHNQFDGFTYYPNTLAFGSHTKLAAPALFGGYEYTPAEMDKDSNRTLAEKHDEALKVMPALFYNNGFDVTVCDPPFAGYQWLPDLSIYSDYPDMHTYVTSSKFQISGVDTEEIKNYRLDRNFFCYSLFRISPLFAQPVLYNDGQYNDADPLSGRGGMQVVDGLLSACGTTREILDSYAILDGLSSITKVSDSSEDTFLTLNNDITHSPTILQEPDYTLSLFVDNTEFDTNPSIRSDGEGNTLSMNEEFMLGHYHVNMAGMILLGEWFDYLRELGVYDNTRIIIVSDHGYDKFPEVDQLVKYEGVPTRSIAFNPLLLVKDFNSTGFAVDDTFMTNADVPTIAASGIISDTCNPFTGNSLDGDVKKQQEMYLAYSFNLKDDVTNFIIEETYVLKGDMTLAESWSQR